MDQKLRFAPRAMRLATFSEFPSEPAERGERARDLPFLAIVKRDKLADFGATILAHIV